MRIKKSVSLLILALVSIILFSGCASPANPQAAQRVNEALDKIVNIEAAHLKGDIKINMNADGQSIDMNIGFDMKKASSEDMQMTMNLTGLVDMNIEMYAAGGNYYMYSPILSDKYIDITSQYKEQLKDKSFIDMSMFEFDAATTSITLTENAETGTTMADVHLGDEQMQALIKKVYAQQNSGSLSEQSQKSLDILQAMKIESAQYTIYMDKDNNIFKLELKAKISVDYMGQNIKLDMTAGYDVLETGDSVKVEIPEIPSDKIITMDELTGGLQ